MRDFPNINCEIAAVLYELDREHMTDYSTNNSETSEVENCDDLTGHQIDL